MNVIILQAPLIWHDAQANFDYFSEKIKLCPPETDLIVLPEMFLSGFTMQPNGIALETNSPFLEKMQLLSNQLNCAITGSLAITENQLFFNRLFFWTPNQPVQHYDKKHLFSLAGEDTIYQAGNEKKIFKFKDWRICTLICYDLRFPVFSRLNNDYDLLIYVANWPESRTLAWDSLLRARAIENQCYVVACNRIGTDQNQLSYIGHSQVIDALGNYLIEPYEEEFASKTTLNLEELNQIRNKFPFQKDRDSFQLT